jgi:hypothetical protein
MSSDIDSADVSDLEQIYRMADHESAEADGEMAERTRETLERQSTTMSSFMLLVSAGHESFMQCFRGPGRGKRRGFGVGLECSVIMFWKINSHYCASLQAPLGVKGVFQQGRLPRRVRREGLYRQTE